MKKFSVKYLDSLKPQADTYEIMERDGFAIRVYPSGKKSFYYIYKDNGKPRKKVIGPYPAVTLAVGREKAGEMHSRRKQGLPLTGDGILLKDLAADYIRKYAKKKKASWLEDKRILEKDVLKKIGGKRAVDVRRGDVTKLLDGLSSKPFTARNAFKVLRRLYNWAIESDQYGLEFSPCDRLSQPVPDTKKDRFLTPEEIRTFWYGILKTNISRQAICAMRFILVTGQRPSECCELEMCEIDGDWWDLPGARAKNGKGNRVFLSALAKSLIDPDTRRKYAFPSSTKPTLSHTSLSQSLKRFRDAKDSSGNPLHWPFADFTPHDLRRTCATYLGELGFSHEVIGAVLNHQAKDVTGIYNRYRYDKEKMDAMLAWEKRLSGILASGCEPDNRRDITKAELKKLVWSMPIREVGKNLGVSDVAVHKMCKRLDVEKPPRGYWLRGG